MINMIEDTCKFSPEYGVKNSLKFINQNKYIELPTNAKLIKFAICNLFSSISPSEATHLIPDLLDKNSVHQTIKSEFITALEICLQQKIISNLMISNVGPKKDLLWLILLVHSQPKFSYTILKEKCINILYEDDIIICFTGTNRQLTFFFQFIQTIHNRIIFRDIIKFLDLTD